MVVRGGTRGNGTQLANYLLTLKDNEEISVLEVLGSEPASDKQLHRALFGMGATAELTKSTKGLYHAQINPAYGEDESMVNDHWLQAADIMGKELGLANQRRVIVLHKKKGRTHAHVVWERYCHVKGIMISDSFSRLAQDRARIEMERVFNHKPTCHRNPKRPVMKQLLTELWQQTKTGFDFIRKAAEHGYSVALGEHRRPYMVVDDSGRSFDLLRHLQGVKTKEVRDRLKDEPLVSEKQAIEAVRLLQAKATTFKNNCDMFDQDAHKKPGKENRVKVGMDSETNYHNETLKGADAFVSNAEQIGKHENKADKVMPVLKMFFANKIATDQSIEKVQDKDIPYMPAARFNPFPMLY